MSICGLVLHAHPEKLDAVNADLAEIASVEVHAATEDGRLVVTVDEPDEAEAIATLTRLQRMDGVLSTSLIYSHFENDPDAKEEAHDSVEA